jgi:hypothetical protein
MVVVFAVLGAFAFKEKSEGPPWGIILWATIYTGIFLAVAASLPK